MINQRKLKRMLSNRESARRSRMRKQKHMDDLKAQVSQLQKENSQILIALNITTQHYAGVEAENSLLRTQLTELSSRLESLSELAYFMGGSSCNSLQTPDGFTAAWGSMVVNQLPIVASADRFQDCCYANL